MSFVTLSQNIVIQNVIPPVSGVGVTTQPAGAYIDVSQYDAFAFLCIIGNTDRTTQTIQVVQATAAAGTGSKSITGAVNTTLGATDDNKWIIVEMTTDQLDINNNFRYVAVTPTFSGGTVDVGCILFIGFRPRNLPITAPAAQVAVVL